MLSECIYKVLMASGVVTSSDACDLSGAIEAAVLEAQKQKQEPWPFSADRVTYPKHERSLGAEKAMASDLRERNAAWWALVMGAAAALEDAANFLSDSDAKRAAEGAANHYRREANALWPNALGKPVGLDRNVMRKGK